MLNVLGEEQTQDLVKYGINLHVTQLSALAYVMSLVSESRRAISSRSDAPRDTEKVKRVVKT